MATQLPHNAKKFFQGILFDVYHYEQDVFDDSQATLEILKRHDVVTMVTVVGDTIMINNEEQPGRPPFQGLPRGSIEPGEDTLEGAKRELLEETGYVSDDWEPWFVSDPWNNPKIVWQNHFYIVRNAKKIKEQELDTTEKIEVTLVSFEEFLNFRHNPKARNKDLFPILEEASVNEEKKAELKKLLFKNN